MRPTLLLRLPREGRGRVVHSHRAGPDTTGFDSRQERSSAVSVRSGACGKNPDSTVSSFGHGFCLYDGC